MQSEPGEILRKLAHEMRTPLASIRIMAELLADNGARSMSAEQLKYAIDIHTCVLELQDLIKAALTEAAQSAAEAE